MMPDQDNSLSLQQQVRDAMASVTPLQIRGGNTKYFYGNPVSGAILDVSAHQGIVSYEPTELVITARAGTLLRDIEAVLASENQILAFEPPCFGEQATLGGAIACNTSGPRRPFAGAARDFMLGSKIINGKSEMLSFGGQVMKNVAGYDVSRLMAGAMGTLGVIMEVSLKVLPKPETEMTLVMKSGVAESLQRSHQWQRLPLPLSAICFDDEMLYVRISGAASALAQARTKLGGDVLTDADNFWRNNNEHKSMFFSEAETLWRISLASSLKPLPLSGDWFYEWGGAQRWLKTNHTPEEVRAAARSVGGHATLFRGETSEEKFQALPAGLMKIHQQLKQAFDPHGLFNRGRLYRDI